MSLYFEYFLFADQNPEQKMQKRCSVCEHVRILTFRSHAAGFSPIFDTTMTSPMWPLRIPSKRCHRLLPLKCCLYKHMISFMESLVFKFKDSADPHFQGLAASTEAMDHACNRKLNRNDLIWMCGVVFVGAPAGRPRSLAVCRLGVRLSLGVLWTGAPPWPPAASQSAAAISHQGVLCQTCSSLPWSSLCLILCYLTNVTVLFSFRVCGTPFIFAAKNSLQRWKQAGELQIWRQTGLL